MWIQLVETTATIIGMVIARGLNQPSTLGADLVISITINHST